MPSAAPCASEPREVALSTDAAEALRAATDAAWPDEVVCLLAGRVEAGRHTIARCVPVPGAIAGRDHFAVPADAFARAEAAVRAAGLQWLGFAHSHPDGEPLPSATDRRELWRGCVQVVVGGPRRALQWRAFWFCDDGVHELPATTAAPGPEAGG